MRVSSIVILPADKGRATVVMDKTEYTQKVNPLLEDEEAYVLLQSDPMKAFTGRIRRMLTKLKRLRAITICDWHQMKPTDAAMARLWFPKNS